MSIRDLTPLYDAMWRLFMSGMSNCTLPVAHLGLALSIPKATTLVVFKACPLPFHVESVIGGHRNKEYFLKASFVSVEDRLKLVTAILSEHVWEKYGVCIDVRSESVLGEIDKIVTNLLAPKIKSYIEMQKLISTGSTQVYRALWFIKDKSTMEFYGTVQQALSSHIRAAKSQKVVVAHPVSVVQQVKEVAPQFDIHIFVAELQALIVQKDAFEEKEAHYKEIIEHLQNKVNLQYGEIISRKESEAATLRMENANLVTANKDLQKQLSGFESQVRELSHYVQRRGKPKR